MQIFTPVHLIHTYLLIWLLRDKISSNLALLFLKWINVIGKSYDYTQTDLLSKVWPGPALLSGLFAGQTWKWKWDHGNPSLCPESPPIHPLLKRLLQIPSFHRNMFFLFLAFNNCLFRGKCHFHSPRSTAAFLALFLKPKVNELPWLSSTRLGSLKNSTHYSDPDL